MLNKLNPGAACPGHTIGVLTKPGQTITPPKHPVAAPPADRLSSGFCRTIIGPPSDHPRTIPGPRRYRTLLFKPLATVPTYRPKK